MFFLKLTCKSDSNNKKKSIHNHSYTIYENFHVEMWRQWKAIRPQFLNFYFNESLFPLHLHPYSFLVRFISVASSWSLLIDTKKNQNFVMNIWFFMHSLISIKFLLSKGKNYSFSERILCYNGSAHHLWQKLKRVDIW
jgi:hypothetical protein